MLIIQRPTIEPVGDADGNRQSFKIGPLDPGFGHTLGNSLRRTLLSSIPGAAATRVKFANGVALHEFGTIEGVKEDVLDICLNLKDLVVTCESDEPVIVRAEKKGEGALTAADISLTADVTVLNPDLHIAELTSAKSSLAFELRIEKGKGYLGAEGNKSGIGIDEIPLDSIFSPVRRVAFEVGQVRVDLAKDFDQIEIEIETDGSITPSEALSSAGKTLTSLADLIATFDDDAPALSLGDVSTQAAIASELDIHIESLGLNERSRNCLKRAGINTVAQLTNATERDLMAITNFGETSLRDVREKLAERNLALKSEI
ncbi:MAG: DNA-directed RNA polymerase subunit alpha [Acidobacteria bacterium]|nr:DNA-directed RNA polymerase subunit alpha [Acidobacteriota bacterium]